MKWLAAFSAALTLAACADAPTSTVAGSAALPNGPRLIQSQGTRPQVLISQVYGGGGNSGATYKNDFIELHNPGATSVDVSGWSVQYASSAGTSWTRTNLTGSIAAGGYYLVQQSAGTGGTVNLPTPDAIGTTAMSGTNGKVILVSNQTNATGACPLANVIDAVGYASSTCLDATTEWGSATAVLSNTTAALRNDNGCAWTGAAGTDFTVGAPLPRNSATAAAQCGAVTPIGPIATITLSPSSASTTVGQTQAFTATGKDANGAIIAGASFTWSSSNPAVASVNTTGVASATAPGTTQIVARSSVNNAIFAEATLTVGEAASLPAVRFTEIHYDNSGTDVGEAIEIEGPAGTDLTGWSIALYTGSTGTVYNTRTLSGLIANQCSGRGVMVVSYPTNGIQNGGDATTPEPDGFALVDNTGTLVEFLSYEGSFMATAGPALNVTSRDIIAKEEPAPASGTTLQRSLADSWSSGADNFGGCNGRTTGTGLTTISFSGRLTTDIALPVGFQDQIFATVRRAGVSTSEAVVWSADTPNLATIDSRGVITARGAGAATFRATTTDGLTVNTYTLNMTVATPWATPTYAGNAEFGEPSDGTPDDEIILRRAEYTTSFSKTRHIPNWASYNLESAQRGALDRCDCFTFDPELIAAGQTPYTTADYTGAGAWWTQKVGSSTSIGIDRGHLVRSFDRTQGSLDNAHTFYFANIVPQFAENNQGPWAALESALGDSSNTREVYIIAGASGSLGTLKDEGNITIPSAMWKVALIVPRDARLQDITSLANVTVVAVIMPNVHGIRNTPWQNYRTTVDAVEMLSGYDVLALLRDDLETALESGTKPPTAMLNGPYAAAEGSTISMSGAASSDPDAGQSLTYAWSFGDGATATGVSTSHSYADNGSYTVRLIVTDPLGLADTTTSTAVIDNVEPTVGAFAGASLFVGESYAAVGSFIDPGSDTYSATVDYGDGSGAAALTLNAKAFSLAHRYTSAGTFTVTVTVMDDDAGTATRSATVTVLSEVQALAAAAATVDVMIGGARLNRGPANSLKVKLDNAAASFTRGNTIAAVNQAEAALNELDGLVRGGLLTEGQAATTRALIVRAIASLNR